jgi:hypothetical protein
MNEVINGLNEVELIGSPPNFFEDWRLHKRFSNKSKEWSGLVSKRWIQVALYTLDYRIGMKGENFGSFTNGLNLFKLRRKIGQLSYDVCTKDSFSNITTAENILHEIHNCRTDQTSLG